MLQYPSLKAVRSFWLGDVEIHRIPSCSRCKRVGATPRLLEDDERGNLRMSGSDESLLWTVPVAERLTHTVRTRMHQLRGNHGPS